MKKQEAHMPAV